MSLPLLEEMQGGHLYACGDNMLTISRGMQMPFQSRSIGGHTETTLILYQPKSLRRWVEGPNRYMNTLSPCAGTTDFKDGPAMWAIQD